MHTYVSILEEHVFEMYFLPVNPYKKLIMKMHYFNSTIFLFAGTGRSGCTTRNICKTGSFILSTQALIRSAHGGRQKSGEGAKIN